VVRPFSFEGCYNMGREDTMEVAFFIFLLSNCLVAQSLHAKGQTNSEAKFCGGGLTSL